MGMYTKVKQGGSVLEQRISNADLLSNVTFLSRLLKGEFIFVPEGVEINAARTLLELEVLFITKSC